MSIDSTSTPSCLVVARHSWPPPAAAPPCGQRCNRRGSGQVDVRSYLIARFAPTDRADSSVHCGSKPEFQTETLRKIWEIMGLDNPRIFTLREGVIIGMRTGCGIQKNEACRRATSDLLRPAFDLLFYLPLPVSSASRLAGNRSLGSGIGDAFGLLMGIASMSRMSLCSMPHRAQR